ncbi:MAG: AbrB/MazE/SpoVT family DNA-binding domain-containing protein [Candidatus Woesearchaeota archaeon]|nr:AbrB/MazE/SpoVT family DNA-binding domain-containing protein [Candidatus Woesearchaeota archaeon]
MKKCHDCGGIMKERRTFTPDNIPYRYFHCARCGEGIVNMEQLHEVATIYRTLKKYHVKISKWGMSLGVRIPKELAEKYKLKNNEELILIPDKDGIKMVPA